MDLSSDNNNNAMQKQKHYCNNKLPVTNVFLIWDEKGNHKSNQQVFSNQIPCSHFQINSNQIPQPTKSLHFDLFQIFESSNIWIESPLIWTQLWQQRAKDWPLRNSRRHLAQLWLGLIIKHKQIENGLIKSLRSSAISVVYPIIMSKLR